jgi:hypothetical protein
MNHHQHVYIHSRLLVGKSQYETYLFGSMVEANTEGKIQWNR